MRMIEVSEFGGPDVLRVREAPDPQPAPGEVLIDVSAADTLLVETDIRAGRFDFGITPPYVPGAGVAGTITALGEGTDPTLLGTRIAALTPDIADGYADKVTVPANLTVPIPDDLEFTAAAALTNDGATAIDLFEAADIHPGQWVLVVGATGGMGALLVQLALNAGAQVIAAARGAHKLALARELGAETVVDYSQPGWTDHLKATVVLDGVGGDIGTAAFAVTADGGHFSAHGAPPAGAAATIDPAEATRRGIDLRTVQDLQQDPPQRRDLLAKAVAENLHPLIGQTFPLERAADAHAAMETRQVTGKTLLIP